MTQGLSRKSNDFKVKRSDVIWSLHRDQVMQEIAKMLDVEDATMTTAGWFQMRMPAIKNVYDQMTPQEKLGVRDEQDRVMRQGYSEETKQR
jgi:hypothetical protein